MARTRTQAGVIKEKKYDYKTIRLGGEKTSTPTRSGKGKKKGGRTAVIGKGKTKGGKRSSGTSQEKPVVALSDVDHEPTPQPEPGRPDITEGSHWWPSVVLGEREETGLR